MTYVVAAKRHGQVAIISDFGVSVRDDPDKAVFEGAIKTGMMFDGCWYGIAGSADDARHFLTEFKTGLPASWTVRRCWEVFKMNAKHKPRGDFQPLLSNRHYQGEPHIYLYDARRATVEPMGDFATIGAGKAALDESLQFMQGAVFPQWELILAATGSLHLWPNLYSLWLNQFAMCDDCQIRDAMQRAGVAGLFHFVGQDSERDFAQGRSAFAMAAGVKDTRSVELSTWNITRTLECVAVRNVSRNHGHVSWDTHANPELKWHPPEANEAAMALVTGEGATFYGFGFSDPKLFPRAFFKAPKETFEVPLLWDSDWVDKNVVSHYMAIMNAHHSSG